MENWHSGGVKGERIDLYSFDIVNKNPHIPGSRDEKVVQVTIDKVPFTVTTEGTIELTEWTLRGEGILQSNLNCTRNASNIVCTPTLS